MYLRSRRLVQPDDERERARRRPFLDWQNQMKDCQWSFRNHPDDEEEGCVLSRSDTISIKTKTVHFKKCPDEHKGIRLENK
eukprot:gene2017-1998_t